LVVADDDVNSAHRDAQRQLESNPHAKVSQRKSLLAGVQGIAVSGSKIVQFATTDSRVGFFQLQGMTRFGREAISRARQIVSSRSAMRTHPQRWRVVTAGVASPLQFALQ
jgi:hypothetical protein